MDGFVMEAMMDGINRHAAFYRAYLPHDRSVIPMAVALAAMVALWLSLYCVSAERTPQIVQKEARAAAVLVCRPVSH
jgi:ABC-type glycerol-3-phosphate transport system permease component